jgi:hypothetical protein
MMDTHPKVKGLLTLRVLRERNTPLKKFLNFTSKKMKYILCSLLFILCLSIQAQNSLSFCFQPDSRGYGLRYDYAFNKVGLYASFAKGCYTFQNGGIEHHTQAAAGTTYFFHNTNTFLSAGASYNVYQGVTTSSAFNPKALKPWDSEVGAGYRWKYFVVAFRYGILKHVSSIELGINFKL